MYPPFAVGAPTAALPGGPAVSEVHLRRLDRDNILHRRAVAEICIDASTEEVCVHRGIAWRRATHCSNAEHRIMEPITSCMCMLTDKHTTKVRMPLVGVCYTYVVAIPSTARVSLVVLSAGVAGADDGLRGAGGGGAGTCNIYIRWPSCRFTTVHKLRPSPFFMQVWQVLTD